jgi:hypothetical protein
LNHQLFDYRLTLHSQTIVKPSQERSTAYRQGKQAVMTMRNAACLAEFALSPLFTRQWSSIYEALQDSRPDRKKRRVLYIKQLEQQVPGVEHVLVAIDHSMG